MHDDSTERAVKAAHAMLRRWLPFLSPLLSEIRWKYDASIGSTLAAGTDGESISVGARFAKLHATIAARVYLHQIMHVAYDHLELRSHHDDPSSNVAIDLVTERIMRPLLQNTPLERSDCAHPNDPEDRMLDLLISTTATVPLPSLIQLLSSDRMKHWIGVCTTLSSELPLGKGHLQRKTNELDTAPSNPDEAAVANEPNEAMQEDLRNENGDADCDSSDCDNCCPICGTQESSCDESDTKSEPSERKCKACGRCKGASGGGSRKRRSSRNTNKARRNTKRSKRRSNSDHRIKNVKANEGKQSMDALRRRIRQTISSELQTRGFGLETMGIEEAIVPENIGEFCLTELMPLIEASPQVGQSEVRYDRRFMHMGLYLPREVHQTIGPILIAVDTSGSVTSLQLGCIERFLDEIQKLGVFGSVIDFDTEVQLVQEFGSQQQVCRNSNESTSTRVGRGGTDLRVPFAHLARSEDSFRLLLVITDGDGPMPTTPPDIPVVWLDVLPTPIKQGAQDATPRFRPPFGTAYALAPVFTSQEESYS
ncbi:MAG: VWA-like domain-containing protein [Limnohabitans sp.]|nr:VWA-like domain-containing protein [Limnohabitans sp.]